MLIADLDVVTNGILQFPRGAVHAPPNLFLRQGREPAFHQIEPGSSRGREVQMETGMPGTSRCS